MDLSGNPLSPHLQTAAGDCSSQRECQLAATRVQKFQAVYQQENGKIIIKHFENFLPKIFLFTPKSGMFEKESRAVKEGGKGKEN